MQFPALDFSQWEMYFMEYSPVWILWCTLLANISLNIEIEPD